MENSPLFRLDLRLRELDYQINRCLQDIRQYLQELKAVTQSVEKAQSFADVLREIGQKKQYHHTEEPS